MPPYGFFVEFEARAGKEDDVEQFLREAKLMVDAEPGTLAWFAFRFGPSSFRIFDASGPSLLLKASHAFRPFLFILTEQAMTEICMPSPLDMRERGLTGAAFSAYTSCDLRCICR